ncbi:SH3 domain-containing protein [Phenylobacterium sp.]|uniref:SH3 domain-containing protein n=1 Tax=Phenylobacterium sp. TaxID=1871053 RepID=UPI0025F5CF95|nr:SH3 domain-containing protein [Phenylobacterium sp.]
MDHPYASRRFRMAVSAIALLSLNAQPAAAQFGNKGGEAALNACATERAPLVRLDTDYKELKRSKMGAAIGQGLKQGAMVLAKGVMSGGMPGMPGGGGGGGLGGAMGGLGGMMGAAAGMAAGSQNRQGAAPSAAAASPAGMLFGQDMLSGAMGLQVPGISGGGFGGGGGGDNLKAYAALAVLVAIVATAEAYAQLKEQEAGGDLRKASYNIDQDAARQLAVSREIVTDGSALVDCRSRQLTDINTRLAGASNDKDRKAIRRERTELTGALKKDIDLTGGVVDQHIGMAKTFTQGRAMTDGSSEADVLGGQAPAYAAAPATTKLAMPAKGAAPAAGAPAQTQAVAPAPTLVALKATAVRSAPVASAAVLMTFPAGREVKPKTSAADGGWWEIDVAGASGYVRAADLGPPGSAPVQVAANTPKGKGGKGAGATKPPPPPPVVAGPTNIRAYNQTVIAARDNGKGRLSSLMTDIQTSERRENVFYAMLSNWRWG